MAKRKQLQTALNYVQQGKLDRAIAEYQAILGADPSNCNVLNALGDLCARIGNRSEAIAYFMRLADVYRADGFYERAIAVYKKVLRLDLSNADASLACAELYADQGLVAEAKLQFHGLADTYLKKGDVSRTLEIYEKIILMDPGHRPTLSKVVGILVRPERVGESLAKLNALGERLVMEGQAEAARQIYEGAVAALQSQGRAAEAASFADALRFLDPAEAEARGDEVLAAAFPGEGDQAEPAGKIAEQASPVEIFSGPSVEQNSTLTLEEISPAVEELSPALEEVSPAIEEVSPVLEETSPALETISPASEAKTPAFEPASSAMEQDSPTLELHEELGGWFDAEPEGAVSLDDKDLKHLPSKRADEETERLRAAEEMMERRYISFAEEAQAGEETEPAVIELDPVEGSEEMAMQTEQPSERVELAGPQALEEQLQEARFFLQQGMIQEARAILHGILQQDPEHPLAKQHLAIIERLEEASGKEEIPSADVKQTSIFRVAEAGAAQGEFVDLAGELNQELSPEEVPVPSDLDPQVQKMLHQLDQGIRNQLEVTDYETRYNLGLAYKDLELYDKAIEQFRLAANDATYRVRCASLLGLCFLAKGEPERSVEELLKGLAATEGGTDERWGVLYDLATAYEALGNAKQALEALIAIYSEAPKFRDIRLRVRDIRSRLDADRGSSRG